MEIKVTCDRCKKDIEGIETETASGGFYRTGPDSPWHKYVHDESEEVICDACMFASPKYQSDYGKVSQ